MPCLADQINDQKRELERKLTDLVKTYEATTGFWITSIEVESLVLTGKEVGKTFKVMVSHGIERNSIPISYV
jgi:hypothetical protein